MTTNVRTQSITNGQIGQINDRLATKLRESGILSEEVQRVLMVPGGAAIDEMVAVFRKHVEAQSEMIVRRVKVDRSRTPRQVVEATGRTQCVDDKVLATMPLGEGEEVDVFFFPLKKGARAQEFEHALASRGLKADPYAQTAVNEADPAFADDHPNASQWDVQGRTSSYLVFNRWNNGRSVDVDRRDDGWGGHWWVAGVRK